MTARPISRPARSGSSASAGARCPNHDRFVKSTYSTTRVDDRHRQGHGAGPDPQQVEKPEHGHVVDDEQPEPAGPDEDARHDRRDVEGDRQREQALEAGRERAARPPNAPTSWTMPVTISSAAASSTAAGRRLGGSASGSLAVASDRRPGRAAEPLVTHRAFRG